MLSASERLQKLIETEEMTAKQFSEEVGIQPGTVSNILKGRNNPSLEVMQKVLQRFRSLSSDWLILGIGSMYRQKNDSQAPTLFDIPPETDSVSDSLNPSSGEILPVNTLPKQTASSRQVASLPEADRHVQKIVVFYDDGTYEEILNR